MTFTNLTSDQVTSVHRIYYLLRRLSVIGVVRTSTVPTPLTDFGKPLRYHLKFAGYDPSLKGRLMPDEAISQLLDAAFRQAD